MGSGVYVRLVRAVWTLVLVILTVGLASRAIPPRVAPAHEAQLVAASLPGSPFEPTAPEPAQRQLAPFVAEILDALVLARPQSTPAALAPDAALGPRPAHAPSIDRPPIAALLPS